MNKSLLFLALLSGICTPSLLIAQNAPVAALPQNVPVAAVPQNPPAQASELQHFDLDFPGGTPADFAAAISKAMGKHLNLIIPESHAKTQIMPVKVEGVTVPQLFTAIQEASMRRVPAVSSSNKLGPGAIPGQKSINYTDVSIRFQNSSKPVTDESVWSFMSSAPTAEDLRVLDSVASQSEPEPICQYFQLGPYLQDHTVEDITTAIQTGWKMLKVDPVPQISFHQETKLLIAVGAAELVGQIPNVLSQLPLDNSAAVDKIAKWQAELDGIEAKKAADWEKQAETLREKIVRLASAQRARETIQNSLRPGNLRQPSDVPAISR